MKTYQVLLEDLLDAHGDLSFSVLVKEALAILSRKDDIPKVQENKIELKYEDLSGKWLTIEVERELSYALQDFAGNGELTIVVSTGQPEQKQQTDGQVAVPPVPTVTPKRKKKRATKSSACISRKKAKVPTAPAAAIAGPMPEAVASVGAPVAVKSEETEAGAINSLPPAMSGVAIKIYNALAEMHALGIPTPQRHHVALLAGYTNVRSTGFAKALGAVKKRELIVFPSGSTVALSPTGIEALPSTIGQPKNNDEMKMRLVGVIKSPKAGEVYDCLFDGKVHRRSELAAAVGYTNIKSTGFAKVLSKLGGLGVLHYPDSQTVQLTDIAFPYGRPN